MPMTAPVREQIIASATAAIAQMTASEGTHYGYRSQASDPPLLLTRPLAFTRWPVNIRTKGWAAKTRAAVRKGSGDTRPGTRGACAGRKGG